MAESLSEQVARHDCEEWHNEGIGCTHCHAVLYPAPPAPEVTELQLRQAYYEGYSDAEADPHNTDLDRFHKAWLESWTYREYPAAPTERTEATPPQAAP